MGLLWFLSFWDDLGCHHHPWVYVTPASFFFLVAPPLPHTPHPAGTWQAFGKREFFEAEAARCTDAVNATLYGGEGLNLWLAFW